MESGPLEFLFGLRKRVAAQAYAGWGFGLLALKYVVDWALSVRFAAHALDPIAYLNPILSQRLGAMGTYPSWLPVAMALWGCPSFGSASA